MQGNEFVALDCETTGLDYQKDKLIELGAVKFSLSEDFDSFDSLFNPFVRIPNFVSKLTGITNEELSTAPSFEEKRDEFAQFCEGKILIGHNLPFDLSFLEANGLKLANPIFDTFLLAGLLLLRGESLSLSKLSQKFNLAHEDKHRALSDSEATRDLFRVLVEKAQEFPQERWKKILELKVGTSFAKNFAKFVLDLGEWKEREEKAGSIELVENRKLTQKLEEISKRGGANLLEATFSSKEILGSLAKLEIPVQVFCASNFEARKFQSETMQTKFASRFYVDEEKLKKFAQKDLSESEASFLAKLILHEGKNFYEINLNRSERLLFDFVASEETPSSEKSKITLSDFASFEEVYDGSKFTLILDAMSLREKIQREKSVIFDLPTLELLVPKSSQKLEMWWGILGMLIREANPKFGKLNLEEAEGLASFSKVIAGGKAFLEEARGGLPPIVVRALENFLSLNQDFSRSLRTNQNEEIILEIAPNTITLPRIAKGIYLDSALDCGDNFAFAKQNLEISEAEISKIETQKIPELFLLENIPQPNSFDYNVVLEKVLIKLLSRLEGNTTVLFGNNREAGEFQERLGEKMDFPIHTQRLASKNSSSEKEIFFTTPFAYEIPQSSNLVLVKIPFLVKEGNNFEATLCESVLRVKRLFLQSQAKEFYLLDPRILEKNYGKNFLDALPSSGERISIEC